MLIATALRLWKKRARLFFGARKVCAKAKTLLAPKWMLFAKASNCGATMFMSLTEIIRAPQKAFAFYSTG